MPRFGIGERVITPKDGQGEIVMVYPKGPRGLSTYGVSVEHRRISIICDEKELKAAPHIPAGKLVRCADCALAHKSEFFRNAIYCLKLTRAKARDSDRNCQHFKPKPAQPAAAQAPCYSDVKPKATEIGSASSDRSTSVPPTPAGHNRTGEDLGQDNHRVPAQPVFAADLTPAIEFYKNRDHRQES